ncbi:uncharacterized protein FSUBG_10689 [Fusarium subglutinans]|uniref:DUF6590 domain-containing protein n=1 Tax=Gibberella subglutinans TaxID=42677 RepID=A0A8H5LGR1_GIBSU|nr:uncharacterized protein FSUBG_10689 [Fusarium subglutinans]KAF5590825.1 hypothetical protein FSUBG_10689 [Fusarium subglutinans]
MKTQWILSGTPLSTPPNLSTTLSKMADLVELYTTLKDYEQIFASLKPHVIAAKPTLDGSGKFAFELASTEAGRCLSMTRKLFECNLRVHRFLDTTSIQLNKVHGYTLEQQEKQIALATEALGGLGTMHDILEGILQALKREAYAPQGPVEKALGVRDNQHMTEPIEQTPDVTHETMEVPEYDETLDPCYRTAQSHMFQPGEVFKTLWPEPAPGVPYAAEGVTHHDAYGPAVYVSFRRFIVVANNRGHCTCVKTSWFGGPESEKTPGEKFVDSMRGDGDWLKKIDDPPSTALEYTIMPTEMPQGADLPFKTTGKNTKSSTIEFMSTSSAEKSATDTEILSIRFGFTTWSDTMCLFSNESSSTASDA